MEMNLSEKGLKFIIDKETGGRAYYEKKLKFPTWPGVQSGITIGVGWDCGYNVVDQLRGDWSEHLVPKDVLALEKCCGLKGVAAKALLPSVKAIEVPWEGAIEVFMKRTVPRFYLTMLRAYPQADTLPPDAAAALLSLVFNRGAALGGSTRVEMANIKAHLQSGNLAEIPTELKRMKRLWPDTAGLRNRRDDEAELFESALA